MALYPLNEFKSLVASSNWSYFNERRPHKTLDELGWEDDYFIRVLYGLSEDDFQKTVKDRKINNYPHQDIVDADQYEIHWDIKNCVGRKDPTNSTISLSLKIAIITNQFGRIAGIVSLKPSGSSWD